ncbi:MAG: UspA domain protein [Rhizobacter sp.]|nr:UspA domain protein [Rhizobacter sp.]
MHATLHGERTLTELEFARLSGLSHHGLPHESADLSVSADVPSSRQAPPGIKSILAVTDLSVEGRHALERAALLAVAHGASLELMHCASKADAPRVDRESQLVFAAHDITHRLGLAVRTAGQAENSLEDIATRAKSCDLLVLGQRTRRTMADCFAGPMAERLMRRCRCLVLVSRLPPRKRYQRIVVGVDLTPASKHLVEAARAVDAGAELELFHAISTVNESKLRYAEVSRLAISAYRRECVRHAKDRMDRFVDSFGATRNRLTSVICHGEASWQAAVQQQYRRADLLVVGKRRSTPIVDFIFGSVAQRVLRWATSDVLLVPPDFQASTRAAARQRLDARPVPTAGKYRAA